MDPITIGVIALLSFTVAVALFEFAIIGFSLFTAHKTRKATEAIVTGLDRTAATTEKGVETQHQSNLQIQKQMLNLQEQKTDSRQSDRSSDKSPSKGNQI